MKDGPSIEDVVSAVNSVVSSTRTGTAIDRYKVELLWDLGNLLILRGGNEIGCVPDAVRIRAVLEQNGIVAGPTLLRNAVRVRHYWPNKDDYIGAVSSLNTYGKLKEAIQLFDPENGIPDTERHAFLKFARTATYSDILERARLLKKKYISQLPEVLSKIDAFTDALDLTTSFLRKIVESRDIDAMTAVRLELTPEKSKSMRMLISAIQSPDVYTRYRNQVRTATLPSPEALSILGYHALGEVVEYLSALQKENPTLFPKIVEEVGFIFLGELATLLKAIESPVELERYFKNKDVLNRFLSRKGS